jgi:hypothetical protein
MGAGMLGFSVGSMSRLCRQELFAGTFAPESQSFALTGLRDAAGGRKRKGRRDEGKTDEEGRTKKRSDEGTPFGRRDERENRTSGLTAETHPPSREATDDREGAESAPDLAMRGDIKRRPPSTTTERARGAPFTESIEKATEPGQGPRSLARWGRRERCL